MAIGTCGLCGKNPIIYIYNLVHAARGLKLGVGSECVSNYVSAAPYGAQRRARDKMRQMMLQTKMANYIVKQKGVTYEIARAEANAIPVYRIQRFFADQQAERNVERIKARAELLGKFMVESREKLWDQPWNYAGYPRTILSSLQYIKDAWERGKELNWMEPAMQRALARLGLQLPAKPKFKDINPENDAEGEN